MPDKIYPEFPAVVDPTDKIILLSDPVTGELFKTSYGGRFGIEDNTGVQDREIDMEDHYFGIIGSAGNYIQADDGTSYAQVDVNIATELRAKFEVNDGTTNTQLKLTANNLTYIKDLKTQVFAIPAADGSYYVPLSVNNNFADAAGNINISNGVYADNAAALGGGLVANDIYNTVTGELRIVV